MRIMPRKDRCNEEIIHALRQVEGSEKVTEVCRRLGVGEQNFYRWKASSAAWDCMTTRAAVAPTGKQQVEQVVANLALDRHILQQIVRKSS
jgi:putative transposase